MFNRVALIGLGLIGGSIGLALHKAKAAEQVVGYDLGKGVSDRARKVGAIDQAYSTLADAVRGAELVVLATPVGAMRALLQNLATCVTPGAASSSLGDASMLAASGFRDMSRVAGGSPEMYRDICLTNSEAITHWLDEYITALRTIRNSIAEHDKNLVETFANAQELRQQWQLSHDIAEE